MMTLKIYTTDGEKHLVEVENKKAAIQLMVKHNLTKQDVLLLGENLEEIIINL